MVTILRYKPESHEDPVLYSNGDSVGVAKALAEAAAMNAGRLRNAWIRPCNMSGAALEGVVFEGGHFEGVCLDRSDLRRIRNDSTSRSLAFERCSFRGADFGGADLRRIWFLDCTFEQTSFAGALFGGAVFDGGRFTNCNLNDAEFRGASFGAVAFCQRLGGAVFERCSFYASRFDRTVEINGARFLGCDLRQCDLQHCSIVDSEFNECNLDGSDLTGFRTSCCELIDCSFRGASMWGAMFPDTEIVGCNLEAGAWRTDFAPTLDAESRERLAQSIAAQIRTELGAETQFRFLNSPVFSDYGDGRAQPHPRFSANDD